MKLLGAVLIEPICAKCNDVLDHQDPEYCQPCFDTYEIAVKELIAERDRYLEALKTFTSATDKLLAIARSEDCACGNDGCRGTADAWKALESAGRTAFAVMNPEP